MNKIREMSCALAALRDEKLIEGFLRSLLTRNEINEITSRWALVRLLDQGVSQRKVAKKLGLSLCKITRGSRELKKRNSAFKRVIAELHKTVIKDR